MTSVITPLEGDNNKLLDVIMPEKTATAERIERLCARGGKAITVTFTDKWIFTYKDQALYNFVTQVFKKTRHISEFILVKEYSDTGRFHIHGAFYTDNIKAITNLRRKLSVYGISRVKCVDDSIKWSQYCVKDMGK